MYCVRGGERKEVCERPVCLSVFGRWSVREEGRGREGVKVDE